MAAPSVRADGNAPITSEMARKLMAMDFAPYEGTVTNLHVLGLPGAKFIVFDLL